MLCEGEEAMKKCLICLLALGCVLGLCASASAANVQKVGIAMGQTGGGSIGQYMQEMAAYFASLENGDTEYELFLADAAGNGETQLTQLRNLEAQGVQVILLNPVDASIVNALTEEGHEFSVPLVLIGPDLMTVDRQGSHLQGAYEPLMALEKACYVGTNLRQAGLAQGRILAAQSRCGDLNQDGKIGYVILEGDVNQVENRLRTEFSLKAVVDAGCAVECLDDIAGNWTRDEARQGCADALAAYGSAIDAIICSNDALAAAAAGAIEEAGLQVGKDVYLLGIDGRDEAIRLIRDGKMTGTVRPDLQSQARLAVEVAVKLLAGEETQPYHWAEYAAVTQANAN